MTNISNKGCDIAEQFRSNFNAFWQQFFHNSDDYLNALSAKNLIEMKRIFSGINGIVTMLTEMEFITTLKNFGIISKAQYDGIARKIKESSPYTNGYDIKDDKIVAEVKCNFPVAKNAFGAAQIDAIIKDLQGLHDQSLKKKETTQLPVDTRRFMVLLREDESDCFDKAVEKLRVKAKSINIKTEILDSIPSKWDYEAIYIVIIPLSRLNLPGFY